MYSLIVVDDEESMLSGLTGMVNWETMGVSLCGAFRDGSEAIAYLSDHTADIVISDIKMPTATGIDIARFIFEANLDTRVVLLSGYRDFEDARQAMTYGVKHYITKPFMLATLRAIVLELVAELDETGKREDALREMLERQNAAQGYLEERFYIELTLGALSSPESLRKRIQLMGADDDLLARRCALCKVILPADDEQKRGAEESIIQLTDKLSGAIAGFDFHIIRKPERSFFALCVASSPRARDFAGIGDLIEEAAQDVVPGVRVVQTTVYGSLRELAASAVTPADGQDLTQQQDEQQRLTMSYLREGDAEAAASFICVRLESVAQRGLDFAQAYALRMIANIHNELAGENNDAADAYLAGHSFLPIMRCESVGALKQQLLAEMTAVSSFLAHHSKGGGELIVARAKRFIAANYDRDLTLTDVAKHVYLNPAYLSRLFREHSGATFMDFLITTRMQAAARYLTKPQHHVYEVCRLVGYGNVKHFYKLFKKEMGCTPSEYRERMARLLDSTEAQA